MKPLRSNLFSLLNLHIAGVALLLILNLVLGVRLFLAWSTLRAASADQLQQQQTAYRALQLEMSPLRGLAAKGFAFPRRRRMTSTPRAFPPRTPRFPRPSMIWRPRIMSA